MRNTEAWSQAAEKQRGKFEQMITQGKENAVQFFNTLERRIPTDYIINTKNLDFDINENNKICTKTQNHNFLLHQNALNQMIAKTEVLTSGVGNKMLNFTPEREPECGKKMLLHCLREAYSKGDRGRVLIRTLKTDESFGYDGEIRGFLSDSFKRIDSLPIFTTFAEEGNKLGMVPVSGRHSPNYNLDVKDGFSLFVPTVFEPVPSECLIVGASITNSLYGAGALEMKMLLIRLVCENGLTMENLLRKIHLGAKLPENLSFSDATYQLDTQTTANAVMDLTKQLFSKEAVEKELEKIKKAAAQEINAEQVFSNLRKDGALNKKEEKEIGEIYSSGDIELLPPVGLLRSSHAVSLFANQTEEKGKKQRAVELREVAGKVINNYVN